MRWSVLLAALPLVATPARADPLAGERGRSRPLVLVAPDPSDASVAVLAQPAASAALAERQVVVFTVLAGVGRREGRALAGPETAALLASLGLRADGPATTVLVGKDGGVKLRGAGLPLAEILATIDAMPMRQREMRRR